MLYLLRRLQTLEKITIGNQTKSYAKSSNVYTPAFSIK